MQPFYRLQSTRNMATKSSSFRANHKLTFPLSTLQISVAILLIQFLTLIGSTFAQDSSSTTTIIAVSTPYPSTTTSITTTHTVPATLPPTRARLKPTPRIGYDGDGDHDDSYSPSTTPQLLLPNGGTIDNPPDPETSDEITKNQLLNLYFLLLGIGVIFVIIGLRIYRKRKTEKRTRSLQRGQNALRRDLELGGWRIGVNGFGRLGGGGAGQSVARNREHDLEEGLDERGEAPPPYSPRREEEDGGSGGGDGGSTATVTQGILLSPITVPPQSARSYGRRSLARLRSYSSLGIARGSGTVVDGHPRLPSYEDVANSNPDGAERRPVVAEEPAGEVVRDSRERLEVQSTREEGHHLRHHESNGSTSVPSPVDMPPRPSNAELVERHHGDGDDDDGDDAQQADNSRRDRFWMER